MHESYEMHENYESNDMLTCVNLAFFEPRNFSYENWKRRGNYLKNHLDFRQNRLYE
jgi:hypothetical protein